MTDKTHKVSFVIKPVCTCGWRGKVYKGSGAENAALHEWAGHAELCRKGDFA